MDAGLVVDNRYRLDQLLGNGGTGAVFRARDLTLDRDVAVKVLGAERRADPDARRRFLEGAQAVARLKHPSIVAILDCGTSPDGGAFVVMELVRGEDLRRALLTDGRIGAARTARILASVCGAVETAHRDGVLHGDLKPENILLPAGGADAKVLDFGAPGIVVGTPAYMAPEQVQGAAPDARTDVFSLGVIAFEMLSGYLPYGRGSRAEIALAQARGIPPLRAADVSPAIERAVRAALDPDPDRRPGTPQAFAHLINAAIGI